MLVYINIINRSSQFIKIIDNIKLSKNIRKIMLIYNNLPLYIIVSYQKYINIFSKKLAYLLFIQKIQHKYKYKFDYQIISNLI